MHQTVPRDFETVAHIDNHALLTITRSRELSVQNPGSFTSGTLICYGACDGTYMVKEGKDRQIMMPKPGLSGEPDIPE